MLSVNSSKAMKTKIPITVPKMRETRLTHHLLFDLINHKPTNSIYKYFATVSFTCKTSGRKIMDK